MIITLKLTGTALSFGDGRLSKLDKDDSDAKKTNSAPQREIKNTPSLLSLLGKRRIYL